MISLENNLIKRFFLFANRTPDKYGDLDNFLINHPDYHSDSVFILLNTAEPMLFKSVLDFPRKWIFFRVLVNTVVKKNRTILFRNLNLLPTHNFEYFSSLPDTGEPYEIFLKQIKDLNIDIKNLYPNSLVFNDEHQALVHKLKYNVKPWAKQKTLSSGLWLYIHLKHQFSTSKFTFVGFNGNISPQFHNPPIETEYLRNLFVSGHVETYNCIME